MASEDDQRAVLDLVMKSMHGTRVHEATAAIEQAQTQRGFGLGLVTVVANKSVDAPLRQQSGILLKRMIGDFWERDPLKHDANHHVMDEGEKTAIRNLILDRALVGDENSKIRTTIAMIIGIITSVEQDIQKWPQLLEVLVGYIRESIERRDLCLLDGSIWTLHMYIENVPGDLLPSITQNLFQVLYPIANEQSVQPSIREKCLTIYEHIVEELITMSGAHDALIDQLVVPSLAEWINAFLSILAVREVELFGLQNTVVLILKKLLSEHDVKNVLSLLTSKLENILDQVWSVIQGGIEIRNQLCILGEQFNQDQSHAKTKEIVELFLGNAFMFLESVMTHGRKKISKQMANKLDDACFAMITLLMMSHDDVTRYQFEPNDYAVSEDDMYQVNNLRTSVRNVMGRMLDTYHRPGFHALLNAAKRHIEEASTKERQASNPAEVTWAWREREAAVLAFQFIGDEICDIQHGTTDMGTFNPVDFVRQVLGPDFDKLIAEGKQGQHQMLPSGCDMTSVTFLGCRALWCSSHFAEVLPSPVRQDLLKNVILICLATNQPLPVRLAAVKSFDRIAQNIAKEETGGYVKQTLPLLCNILESGRTEGDTTYMLVDAIHTCMKLDVETACEMSGSVVGFLIKLWEQNVEDEGVSSRVGEIVATLCAYPCVNDVRGGCFPVCMSILESCTSNPNFGVATVAVKLLEVMVDPLSRDTPTQEHIVLPDAIQRLVRDVPSEIYTRVIPGIVEMALHLDTQKMSSSTRDERTTEMIMFIIGCVDFVCCCIRSNPQAFCADHGNGSSCVDLAVNLSGKLLSPQEDDSVAIVACGLVSSLCFHVGQQIESRSQAILLAVLQRLVLAKKSGNMQLTQRLLLIFLRFVGQHGMSILDFCANANNGWLEVPVPSTDGGIPQIEREQTLPFVLDFWINAHNELYFDYDKKMSLFAMKKLLEQCFGDEKCCAGLSGIVVSGYEIFDLSAPRRTRSRGPIQKQYTKMPLPVKFLNLMVTTFVSSDDNLELIDEYDSDDESNSFAEDSVDGRNLDRLAAKYNRGNGRSFQVDDYMRHMRDAHFDPMNQINLRDFVSDFVKQANAGHRQKLESMAAQLNEDDQGQMIQIIQS